MAGNLAEQLYLVFCANSGLVPGSGDVPNWASMPIAQRDVWEAVALKAHNVMADRFVSSLRDERRKRGDVVDAMIEWWSR